MYSIITFTEFVNYFVMPGCDTFVEGEGGKTFKIAQISLIASTQTMLHKSMEQRALLKQAAHLVPGTFCIKIELRHGPHMERRLCIDWN